MVAFFLSKKINRLRAFLLHFCISLAVGIGVVVWTRFFLYPTPFYEMISTKNILLLVVAVDVILGPILTLIVFDTQKKSTRIGNTRFYLGLKSDVFFIFLVQFIALSYGVFSLYISRPVYVVFKRDCFELVTATMLLSEERYAAILPEFKILPKFGVVYAGTKEPSDVKELEALAWSKIFGGDLHAILKYYVPLEEVAESIQRSAQPLDELVLESVVDRMHLEKELKNLKLDISLVAYLPLVYVFDRSAIVLVDKKNGEVIQLIDFKETSIDLLNK